MESVKKFLLYVLIAIVFAVGGYFIGKGNIEDQGAALYKAPTMVVDTYKYTYWCTRKDGSGSGTVGSNTDHGIHWDTPGSYCTREALKGQNNLFAPVPTSDVKASTTNR